MIRVCLAFVLILLLPVLPASAGGGRACDTFFDVALEEIDYGLIGTWTLSHTGEWSDPSLSTSAGLSGRTLTFRQDPAEGMGIGEGPDLMFSDAPPAGYDTGREAQALDAWLDSLIDDSQPETPASLRDCPVPDVFIIYGEAAAKGPGLPEGTERLALRLYPTGEDQLDGFLEIAGHRDGKPFSAWRRLVATR